MHSFFDLKKKRRITGDLKMKRPITTGEEEKQEKGKNKRLEKVKQKEKKIKHQKISNDVVVTGKKEISNDVVVTGTKDPVYEKYLGEPDLPEEWTLRTAYLSPIPVPRDHCKYSLFEQLVKKGIRQYNCNGTLYQVQDLFGVSRYRRYQAIRGTIIFTAKEEGEEAAENFLVTFRVLLADEHKIIDFCGKVDWNMADHGD